MPLRNEKSDRISCSWSIESWHRPVPVTHQTARLARSAYYESEEAFLPTALDEDSKPPLRRPFVSNATFFSPNA
ncbi:MAG: hypothetical protein Q8Q12_06420 [bacterium]|nr:hypothetical protein [bacterium]